MNKIELKKKLEDEKISPDMYSLEGGLQDDTCCLDKDYAGWVVYYTERGEIIDRRVFNTEEEACEYLYNWIKEIMKLMGK